MMESENSIEQVMQGEDNTQSFEQAMERLEEIVIKLESGDLPLEQAIDLFQEGTRLSEICSRKLSEVEKKIEMIIDDGNQVSKQPFQPESQSQGDPT